MKNTASKSMMLTAAILMDLLTGMEFDLFVPSFPQLQSHFHLTPFWVEASLSINFIGFCISLFFVGNLSDRFGRKSIILIGLGVFIMGSIFCMLDTTYYFLLLGRFMQGVGIAAPTILSFLIIADVYSIKEQQFLMAILNGSMNIAAALAPVLGSYITLHFNWKGNFVALWILGLLTLMTSFIFVPSTQPRDKSLAPIELGYYNLFKSKPLMLLIITLCFIFTPYWIFVGISPLLFIKDFNVSLHHFGWYQGSFALVFAMGSILYGLMIKRKEYNQKLMHNGANGIFLISIALLIFLTVLNSRSPMWITVAMIVFVIGQIIPSTLLYPTCLNYFPEAKGRISALLQGGRLVISSIGLQIAGFFYNGSFRSTGVIVVVFIVIAVGLLMAVIRSGDDRRVKS